MAYAYIKVLDMDGDRLFVHGGNNRECHMEFPHFVKEYGNDCIVLLMKTKSHSVIKSHRPKKKRR